METEPRQELEPAQALDGRAIGAGAPASRWGDDATLTYQSRAGTAVL